MFTFVSTNILHVVPAVITAHLPLSNGMAWVIPGGNKDGV